MAVEMGGGNGVHWFVYFPSNWTIRWGFFIIHQQEGRRREKLNLPCRRGNNNNNFNYVKCYFNRVQGHSLNEQSRTLFNIPTTATTSWCPISSKSCTVGEDEEWGMKMNGWNLNNRSIFIIIHSLWLSGVSFETPGDESPSRFITRRRNAEATRDLIHLTPIYPLDRLAGFIVAPTLPTANELMRSIGRESICL